MKIINSINIKGQLLDFTTPLVMGILNTTPDSFFQGSRYKPNDEALITMAGKMLDDGATFIDIGGYSTRPDAEEVGESEECERVLPAIEAICKHFPHAIISIDTFRAGVARKAVSAGANIINDISGGNLDSMMFQTVAELNVPYILMHSRGTPKNMSQLNKYSNLADDIIQELAKKVYVLRTLGVKDIIIDPGFGFAKDLQQNYELMRNLIEFKIFNLPLLVGISRKSMIWKLLNILPQEALNATTALNMYALEKGASILRVHDVKEAVETIKLYEMIAKS